MTRIILLICIIFTTPQIIFAQVKPLEGSIVNYRIIGFSVPAESSTEHYTIEIAKGNCNSEQLFHTNLVKTVQNKKNRMIIEVPAFGTQYTWRIIYNFSKSNKTVSNFFHFSTGMIPEVDTNNIRLRITEQTDKYDCAFVFLDGNHVLYDMSGSPVWYLPNKVAGTDSNNVLDLKISPQGTITFLSAGQAVEVNYDGELLWQGPNNGTVSGQQHEAYHHEFTRLNNGHYMVLGNQLLSAHRPAGKDKGWAFHTLKDIEQQQPIDTNTLIMPFGTIIEYDSYGNVVWSWKSSEYYQASDLVNYIPEGRNEIIDLHENAFFFDEEHSVVYLGFKNISRIIKIKYPEGTILNNYGEIYEKGMAGKGNGIFCGQHSLSRSEDGSLLLFNNNSCKKGAPMIEKLEEPGYAGGQLRETWEYTCENDITSHTGYPQGGNVVELTNNALFVATAAPDSKVFIVNPDKTIAWSAVPEKFNTSEKKWYPFTSYRGSIIANTEILRRLIWHDEKKKSRIAKPSDSKAPNHNNKTNTLGASK